MVPPRQQADAKGEYVTHVATCPLSKAYRHSRKEHNMNFDFDIRIPDILVQQMMDGEITCAMLVTMVILRKWSNWDTGIVRRVCASSLCYAANEAYSVRTFQDALLRLEKMGWITRQIVNGSHKWYPVVIHNYKWVGVCGDQKCCPKPEKGDSGEPAGKVHILNPKKIKVSEISAKTICGERNVETSVETSEEPAGRLQTDTSLNSSLNKSECKSELKGGKLVSQLAGVGPADAGRHENQKDEPQSLDQKPSQNLPDPHTYDWANMLHEEFGAYSQLSYDLELWANLALFMRDFGWDTNMLRGCLHWAQGHKFWKNRIVDFHSFAMALIRCVTIKEDGGSGERGLAPQYIRSLNKKFRDAGAGAA